MYVCIVQKRLPINDRGMTVICRLGWDFGPMPREKGDRTWKVEKETAEWEMKVSKIIGLLRSESSWRRDIAIALE